MPWGCGVSGLLACCSLESWMVSFRFHLSFSVSLFGFSVCLSCFAIGQSSSIYQPMIATHSHSIQKHHLTVTLDSFHVRFKSSILFFLLRYVVISITHAWASVICLPPYYVNYQENSLPALILAIFRNEYDIFSMSPQYLS